MRIVVEKISAVPAQRSAAQRAPAKHGRSAAAMDASAQSIEEEYAGSHAGPTVQRKLRTLADRSPRMLPVTLANPHGQRLAKLHAIANRDSRIAPTRNAPV